MKKYIYIVDRLIWNVNTEKYELVVFENEVFSTQKRAEKMVHYTISNESLTLKELSFSKSTSIYNLECNYSPKGRLIITKIEVNKYNY